MRRATNFTVISRDGAKQEISAFDVEDLIKKISAAYQKIVEPPLISHLTGRDVSTETLKDLEKDPTILVYFKSEERKMVSKISRELLIAPDIRAFTRGGLAEYDLTSAIAELVDNSIEATKTVKPRIIEVVLIQKTVKTKPGKKTPPVLYDGIRIKDNGIGMTHKDLTDWATYAKNRTTKEKNIPPGSLYPLSLSSRLSRFGVGSKKASFFLGEELRCETKQKLAVRVESICLSSKTLEQNQKKSSKENPWKFEFVSTPVQTTQTGASFTEMAITKLKREITEQAVTDIKQTLGNIYHYYLFGADGTRRLGFDHIHFHPAKLAPPSQDSYIDTAYRHLTLYHPKIKPDQVVVLTPGNTATEILNWLPDHLRKEFFDAHILNVKPADFKAAVKAYQPKPFKSLRTDDKVWMVTDPVTEAKNFFCKRSETGIFSSFSTITKQGKISCVAIERPMLVFPLPNIDIRVNGHSLKEDVSNLQCQYLLAAKSEFRFTLSLKADMAKDTQYMGTDKIAQTTIQGFIHYYPLIEEPNPKKPAEMITEESHPDIRNVEESEVDKIAKARPSFCQWFWNGRYIRRATCEPWFLKRRPTSVKKESFNRIKASFFVNSSFGVSQHKEALDPDNPFIQMLDNKPLNSKDDYFKTCDAISKSFHSWLSHCERHFDERTQVDGKGIRDGKKTYHPVAKTPSGPFQIGARVQIAGKPNEPYYLAQIFVAEKKGIFAGLLAWLPGMEAPSLEGYPKKEYTSKIKKIDVAQIRPIDEYEWETTTASIAAKIGTAIEIVEITTDHSQAPKICMLCLGNIGKHSHVTCRSCLKCLHVSCTKNPDHEASGAWECGCTSSFDLNDDISATSPNLILPIGGSLSKLTLKVVTEAKKTSTQHVIKEHTRWMQSRRLRSSMNSIILHFRKQIFLF